MSQATLGKWGKNLAVRLPLEVVKAAGLRVGEKVEVEARGRDIVIRRPEADAIADAAAAAAEIASLDIALLNAARAGGIEILGL